MSNNAGRPSRRHLVAASALALSLLAGCATQHPTAVVAERVPQANEGLVTLRLVNASTVQLRDFIVRSLDNGQELPLTVEQFGQTQSSTFVGHLPAGRWQPKTLTGTRDGLVLVTAPIERFVAPFEVQAGRVTDMRTLVFVSLEETSTARESGKNGATTWKTAFRLSTEPTPVPVQPLLQARWPALAAKLLAQPPLAWAGSREATDERALQVARERAVAIANPQFVTPRLLMIGGPMGALDRWDLQERRLRRSQLPTVHGIQAYEVLADGRWLAGGEAGFLAVSESAGKSWTPIELLQPGDVVLLLHQHADGAVWMAVDRDHGVAVYRADPKALSNWQLVKELASDRIDEPPAIDRALLSLRPRTLADFAVASEDRLVVVTHPKLIHSMDFRTGQWERAETPRVFKQGLKITPDGFIAGTWGPDWVVTSTDYGKTWQRMKSWVNMSQPHFIDKSRGWTLVNDLGLLGPRQQHVNATQDGGQNWAQGVETNSRGIDTPWLAPFWTDPSGQLMFRIAYGSMLQISRDGGANWKFYWDEAPKPGLQASR